MTPRWWTYWTFDPLVVLGVVAAGWAYAIGVRTIGLRRVGRWRVAAFAAALLTILLALASPIDRWSSVLLSVHMAQHLLMMVVAGPLLVLSRPVAPLSLSLPRRARVGWRRLLRAPPLARVREIATNPIVAWLTFTSVMWAWHAPGPYQAAVSDPWVHAAEHLSFLGSAVLFWWVALADGPHRILTRGADVLFVLTAWLQSGALGVLFTFAGSPIYPAYAVSARAVGVSPVYDQQLAGLIMWIPAGVVYLGAALSMAVQWLHSMDRYEPAPQFEPDAALAAGRAGSPS